MRDHHRNRRQAVPHLVWSGAAVSIASPTVDAREVTATENLMRGQGVIRRALLVYSETAPLLRSQPASVDPAALYQTAQLFRRFGQDYHERMLEEDFVFPIVRILGGRAGKYPDVLEAQHRRGREINDYILRVTKTRRIGAGQAEPLAVAMEGLSRMYEHHAAREHTIVFPAWRSTMTGRQLDEMSGMFEEIGQREFGRNGFAEAERTMDEIEERLGLSDISRFTAPQINANKRGDCGAGL